MDPISNVNSGANSLLGQNYLAIQVLEQTIDQLVNQELAAHKVDPAKSVARQITDNFQQQLAKASGEVQQAQVEVAASSPPGNPQAMENYAYWKSQLEYLQGQDATTSGIPADTTENS